jgi:hypothetical protein
MTQPSDKLVINFSTLSAWSKGNPDKAVDCYFHTGEQNEAMKEGTRFHSVWEAQIKLTKKLKIGNTILRFKKPQCEYHIRTKFSDDFDCKGTIDCLDIDKIGEWKTGKTDIKDWAATQQIPFYFMLCGLVGLKIDYAELYHWNQHTEKGQYMKIYNDESRVKAVRNWAETLAGEMLTYWTEHNIPFNPDYYKSPANSGRGDLK